MVWVSVTCETTLLDTENGTECDVTSSVAVTGSGWLETKVGKTASVVLNWYPPEPVDSSASLVRVITAGELDERVGVATKLEVLSLGVIVTITTGDSLSGLVVSTSSSEDVTKTGVLEDNVARVTEMFALWVTEEVLKGVP
jgi:hypothetical protein